MKRHIVALLADALEQLKRDGKLPVDADPEIQVERARDRAHGDYAANTAMMLAKVARKPPRELAEAIRAALPPSPDVASVEVAGPGFLNFILTPAARLASIRRAVDEGADYGRGKPGSLGSALVEFVSANPTGPLHVGHGRGAAFGDALANLLEAAGWCVHREYYVNDAGRQMDILALSLWLRYLQAAGEMVPFPEKAYRGEYLIEHARELLSREPRRFIRPAADLADGLSADEPEAYLDALVGRARDALGADDYRAVLDFALDAILDDIRDDLEAFSVSFHNYFSERDLADRIEPAIQWLTDAGHTYKADGALWFRASAFGDDKDRVLRRENGVTTYFAADVAYHLDKLERGFDALVDVWGSDHHGYVPRLRAALTALGADPKRLEVHLVQFAILYRGGEKLPMSTRAGEFVTLRELRDEVGKDAARFFYAMRRAEQHLDFDLDLAKSQSADNPVYYVQYAHARIYSVFRQLGERGLTHDTAQGAENLHLLETEHEEAVIDLIGRYPEIVEGAAAAREPHQIAQYLRELAAAFHTYYKAVPFIVDHPALRDARLTLITALRRVVANGLAILGVSAPERM